MSAVIENSHSVSVSDVLLLEVCVVVGLMEWEGVVLFDDVDGDGEGLNW